MYSTHKLFAILQVLGRWHIEYIAQSQSKLDKQTAPIFGSYIGPNAK